MIKSFKCKETEKIWNEKYSKKIPPDIQLRAFKKLVLINAASNPSDLKSPPGNFLEELNGDRQGQYSVRINSQWRVCFKWLDNNAFNLEIVDYH